MLFKTVVHAWVKFCFLILRLWLWGTCDGKADRPRCLLYFGRCIYIILFPFLVLSVLATILSLIVGAIISLPFLLLVYLTVGWIKYVYLLCTVKEIWEPGTETQDMDPEIG